MLEHVEDLLGRDVCFTLSCFSQSLCAVALLLHTYVSVHSACGNLSCSAYNMYVVHASVQESTADSFLLSFFDLQQNLIRDVYPNWNQLWKFVSDCMQVRMYVRMSMAVGWPKGAL